MNTSTTDKTSDKSPNASARNKLMDLIARRDHSEKELRQKLASGFTPDQIDQAIQYAKDKKWIADSQASELALSEKTAQGLHRKNKGILFINNYLTEKGLPEVANDDSLELEKALALVKNKRLNFSGLEPEAQDKARAKLARMLESRGFDESIVRKVIYEEL